MNRLEQQLQFILEIDKVKKIIRQTPLSDASRKENDAEHSWHIALMAYLLQEYVEEPVEVSKVMLMVLIHDLVEIDAGDTYAYDDAGAKTKESREKRLLTVFSDCFQKTRENGFTISGKNLRHMKHQKQSTPIC